jgi:uridine nucleosidase
MRDNRLTAPLPSITDIHTDPAGLQAILRPFPFPPVVLAPLNITHTAIFTEAIQKRLLHPDGTGLDGDDWKSKGKSDVRWMLSTLVTFFVSRPRFARREDITTDVHARTFARQAKTYREVFGFMDGPPIHDALCVSWLANPEFFKGKWATLEVGAVTEGPEGRGETRPVKGTEWQELSFEDGRKDGKGGNCYSLMELDVS